MVTLDVYSHIFPSLSEQLKEGLEAAYQQHDEDGEADSDVG